MNTRSQNLRNLRLEEIKEEDEADDPTTEGRTGEKLLESGTIEAAFDFNSDSDHSAEVSVDTSTDCDTVVVAMAATKDDIEKLLKNVDSRKISSFQPVAFSGQTNESAQDFLNQFENYAKLSGLKGEDQIVVFNLLLRGLAKFWFQGLSAQDKATFDTIKDKFKETYLSQSKNWLTTQRLENRKLLPGEKAEMYIQDVIQMANNVGMTANEQRAALIRGLTPKLRSQLVTHNPQTLAETIERIYLSETALSLKDQESVNMVDSVTTCQLAGINATMNKLDEKLTGMAEKTAQLTERQPEGAYSSTYMPHLSQQQHMPHNVPQRPPYYATSTNIPGYPRYPQFQRGWAQQHESRLQSTVNCYVCSKPGHMARDCYYRGAGRGVNNNSLRGYNPGGYNPGGYNPGGYNHGGYNPGGYNPGGYNHGEYNPGQMNNYNGRRGPGVNYQQNSSKNYYGMQRQ